MTTAIPTDSPSHSPTAYPLAWPKGKKRTVARVNSKFQNLTLARAVDRIELELGRIHAKSIVLSSNQAPLSRANPADPGVAVYFQLDGSPVVLACDQYLKVMDNLAAIAAHIEATRLISRHGVATLKEMFAGFLALPGALAPEDWRAVLGNPRTLVQAETVYRERMKADHPDRGGSEAQAAALNAAIAQAREVLA